MAQKLTPKKNYHSRQSIQRKCDVRAFQFLLPAFQSGFRYSRNGGPLVIWIISLYLLYQVYFVIIIVEFLVTVSKGGLSLQDTCLIQTREICSECFPIL